MAEKKSKFGKGDSSLRKDAEFTEFFANVKPRSRPKGKALDENEIHERMVVRSITNGSGRGRSGSR